MNDIITQLTTSVKSFESTMTEPPLPILAHFGKGNFHRASLHFGEGKWDIDRMSRDLNRLLLRSDNQIREEGFEWSLATFGTRKGLFIHYEEFCPLQMFAPTRKKLSLLAKRLSRYWVAIVVEAPRSGSYYLLRENSRGLRAHRVEVKEEFALSEDQLLLNYGEQFPEWHMQFVASLRDRTHGISVMDGPMGTGKTSYIRSLMVELRETHKFFFLPPAAVGLLVNPSLISFWESQKAEESDDRRFVLVIEDSEEALLSRNAGNGGAISALLSMTDGLLSDFLSLHIIATINTTAKEIDPALLRPGRLVATRCFGRLGHREAQRLAVRLGTELPLQEDYSLAEIYARKPIITSGTEPRRSIGFAA